MGIIDTFNDRRNQRGGIKGALLGPSGIGKTSQLLTLDPATTLFVDLEAGDLAVEGWQGDRIDVFAKAQDVGMSAWEMTSGIACWMGGPSPLATRPEDTYSKAHYSFICDILGDPAQLAKYKTIFVDSITVASRACMAWAKAQPRAQSTKKTDASGKPAQDMLGAYGLLKEEMVGWLTQFQHIRGPHVWVVGILDKYQDDFGRTVFAPQVEGSGTANALPGIFDQIVSMVELKDDTGAPYRAFVCQTLNQWSYPAKDRSRQLDLLEPPSLGALIEKISKAGAATPSLSYAMPAGSAAVPT